MKDGKITIATRVFDIGGTGGFFGPAVSMNLTVKDDDAAKPISLTRARGNIKSIAGDPEPIECSAAAGGSDVAG